MPQGTTGTTGTTAPIDWIRRNLSLSRIIGLVIGSVSIRILLADNRSNLLFTLAALLVVVSIPLIVIRFLRETRGPRLAAAEPIDLADSTEPIYPSEPIDPAHSTEPIDLADSTDPSDPLPTIAGEIRGGITGSITGWIRRHQSWTALIGIVVGLLYIVALSSDRPSYLTAGVTLILAFITAPIATTQILRALHREGWMHRNPAWITLIALTLAAVSILSARWTGNLLDGLINAAILLCLITITIAITRHYRALSRAGYPEFLDDPALANHPEHSKAPGSSEETEPTNHPEASAPGDSPGYIEHPDDSGETEPGHSIEDAEPANYTNHTEDAAYPEATHVDYLPGETIQQQIAGLNGTLILTPERLILIRHDAGGSITTWPRHHISGILTQFGPREGVVTIQAPSPTGSPDPAASLHTLRVDRAHSPAVTTLIAHLTPRTPTT